MISQQLTYSGNNKEFQFRDHFIMPLLIRLGFGVVVNYHGAREFGRDVIFGDIDRFGHVVYYGMQIKYESSIGLGDSTGLIDDAQQATHNPFNHPHTGRPEFISCFYIANAGDISEQARTNFFSGVTRHGVRDARLLDGNALLLLDKAAALNRNAQIKERLTGIIQEIRRNQNVLASILPVVRTFLLDVQNNPWVLGRCRNIACGGYLHSPFPIPGISVDQMDQYFETVSMANEVTDSIGKGFVGDKYREARFKTLEEVLTPMMSTHAAVIDAAASHLLLQLSESAQLTPLQTSAASLPAAIDNADPFNFVHMT